MSLNFKSFYKACLVTFISLLCLIFSELKAGSELVVIADTHGAFEEYTELLKGLELIDEEHNWAGGERLLVSLGDNLDRGPDSRKTLDLFMKLEEQGAKLKLLLGNHEIMNLIGDLRYVSKEEYAAFSEDESQKERKKHYKSFLVYSQLEDNDESMARFQKLYPLGYFAYVKAFSTKGKYGKWLLQKDIVANIDRNILLHGGISEQTLDLYKDIEILNLELKKDILNYMKLSEKLIKAGLFKHHFSRNDRKEVAQALIDGLIKSKRLNTRKNINWAKEFLLAAKTPLFKGKSPIWYRGMAFCHQYAEDRVVDKALKQYQGDRVLLGHSPTNDSQVNSRFDGKVILLDTGMLKSHYSGQSNAVLIKNGELRVYTQDSSSFSPAAEGVIREPAYTNDKSDDYLSDFYQNAKVTASKVLPETYSKPHKLTFELNGKVHKAIFKTADSDPGLHNKTWRKEYDYADRYMHDLAAYRLDRLLGLYMVPFTMEYEYQGKKGALQYWVEDSISKTQLIQQKKKLKGYCNQDDESELMKVFDWLIFNEDRNTGNRLFSEDYATLWLIDHTRAFRSQDRSTPKKETLPDYISPRLITKLEALTRSELQKHLGKFLHRDQIKGILHRRDRLLSDYSKKD